MMTARPSVPIEAKSEIIVYQPNETVRLDVRMSDDTVWLTQAQMVQLFHRDQSVIARHIANVFKEGEVDKGSNMHFLHIPFSDRPVAYYSLDVIISVGYRVKSLVGTRFRQWATRILRDRLLRSVSENARLANLERRVDEGFARQNRTVLRRQSTRRRSAASFSLTSTATMRSMTQSP